MQKRAVVLLILVFMSSSFLVANMHVKAAITITVPDEYPTIAEAVDNAENGDTIFVRAGTYNESLTIDVSIRLVGDDPSTTIINGPAVYNSSGGTSSNYSAAIEVTANKVEISSVTVNNGGNLGVLVDAGSEGAQISGNVLNCGKGVSIYGTYAIVDANIISSSNTAILCASTFSNLTNNNILVSSGYGIYLEGSQNVVTGNNITDPNKDGYGIFVANNSNTIAKNAIFEKAQGISVSGGSNNIVTANSVANCSSSGLGVEAGTNNTFTMNFVTDCSYGAATGTGASSNTFYFNDFLDNTQQVLVQSGVSSNWDNGTNGNYWLDYLNRYPNAAKVDDTGVWNTSYVIDADNVDNYPLMAPFETTASSSAPFPALIVGVAVGAFVVVIAVGLAVYFRKRKQ
jgi:nitrous oxidase accessory protein